jgi:hypothetical protein
MIDLVGGRLFIYFLGTPGFNWYATERLLRICFLSKGIPCYIYYFKKSKPKPPKKEKEEELGESWIPKNPLPNYFQGCNILLFSVNKEKEQKVKRFIVAYPSRFL